MAGGGSLIMRAESIETGMVELTFGPSVTRTAFATCT